MTKTQDSIAVPVLMYHSVSNGPAPTCLPFELFRRQLDVIEELKYEVVNLESLVKWIDGSAQLPARSIILTFDDGFQDFKDSVWPELERRQWPATVFLPTAKVGGRSDWERGDAIRPIMSWRDIGELTQRGVDFGAHGVEHVDLTAIDASKARNEIIDSKSRIEEQIGRDVPSFAAPFGRTSPAIRAEIARHYRLAVGTRLAVVRPSCEVFDIPRIEMHYFRNVQRWRNYLSGRGRVHFWLRQALRSLRTNLIN